MIQMDSAQRDKIIIAILWVVSIIPWFWSTTHLDIARDLVHAHAIAEGQFVTRGPIIGGLFYLAPYWFYLLALPFKVGLGWFATVLFIAVLAGLKFPLVYHYFKLNNNRRAGIIACYLLFLLGWVQHQWLVPTHTVMTPAAVFALLIMFQKLANQSSVLKMFTGGMFFGLCFHAHPTILPMGVLIFWSLNQLVPKISTYITYLMAFAVGSLLMVIPIMLLSQSGDVTYSPTTFMDYLGDLQVLELLKKLPTVFKEIFWGEYGYVVKTNVVAYDWLKDLTRVLLVVTILIMGAYLIRFLKPMLHQYLHLVVTLVIMTVFVTIIREQVPFYMVWSSSALTVVLIAYVLSQVKFKPAVYFIQFSCLMIWFYLAVLLINNQSNGSTFFDFSRMYGFSNDNKFVKPVYMISAGDRDSIAKRVCADDSPIIHGALLNNIIFDYQGGERVWCGDKTLHLSGVDGTNHLTFVPSAMVSQLKLNEGEKIGGIQYFNSIAIYPSERIEIGSGIETYLPKNQYLDIKSEQTVSTALSCEQFLVIHHAYHFLSAIPALTVTANNDASIKLVAENENTRIYGCDAVSENSVSYQIKIKGKGVENIDITAIEID